MKSILGYVVRFSPKSFLRLRKYKGKDVWNWEGVKQVPYRLPQLLKANDEKKEVFLVEGEKDADSLNSMGYCSTTLPGGAGKWRKSYKRFFIKSDLILIPDNDEAGIKGMERIAGHLISVAKRLRIIYLRDEKNKSDISDWLEKNSFNKELLEDLIRTREDELEKKGLSNNDLKKTEIDALNEEYAVLTMGIRLSFSGKMTMKNVSSCSGLQDQTKEQVDNQQKAVNIFLSTPTEESFQK